MLEGQGQPSELERSTIMYDPSEPRLSVESGGNSVEMNFVQPPARFLMQDEQGIICSALWLTEDEASVLDKMLGYVLDKIKITEPSRVALEAIKPRVQRILASHE